MIAQPLVACVKRQAPEIAKGGEKSSDPNEVKGPSDSSMQLKNPVCDFFGIGEGVSALPSKVPDCFDTEAQAAP